MKHIPYFKLLAIAALCASLHAATTDPMGGMLIPIKGASDTRISVPFSRAVTFEGRVDSLSGSTITALGTPGWADGQFLYGDADSIDPANTYYLVFLTGAKEGLALEITANDSSSITVALGSENLIGVQTEAVDGAGNGDIFQIIPYWTPASLFAGTTLPDQTELQVYSNSTIGVFKSPSAYTFYSGVGMWADGSFNIADDYIIFPGEGILVRMPVGSVDLNLTVSGAVPMFQNRQTLTSNASANEIFVGVYSPIDVTLGNSGLGIQDQMEVLVYDNSTSGYFKSPEAFVYYSSVDSWADGDLNVANNFVIAAGSSVVLRKPSTGSIDSLTWTYLPSYLQ